MSQPKAVTVSDNGRRVSPEPRATQNLVGLRIMNVWMLQRKWKLISG